MNTTAIKERLLAGTGALLISVISYLPLTYSADQIRNATAQVYSAVGSLERDARTDESV